MAKKSPQRKADPILPPGTYIVDNPDWDPNAPALDLAEQPKRGKQGSGTRVRKPASTPASPRAGYAATLMLGALIAGCIGVGVWWWLDSKAQADADAQAEAKADAQAEADADAAGKSEPPLRLEDLETRYKIRVAQTAAELGIEAPSVATLLEPNEFWNPVTHSNPAVVAPGAGKRYGPLVLKVRVERLALNRHQIQSHGEHTLLQIQNTSDHPIAYRMIVRKKSNGDCLSPVVFNYDAMVVDAGATTELSVCSGRQSAEILDLRMLAVTELGARWIRQIPPIVVGNTPMAARSHRLADPDTPQCNEDATDITRALEEHLVKWEDVIDFYSRHDCQHYAWVSEYRLAKQALPSLPVLPEQRPPPEPSK